MYTYFFKKEDFTSEKKIILSNEHFQVETFLYTSGIEAAKISNKKGHVIVLPYYGQIIWDVVFDGHSLTMTNMFKEPKRGTEIIDTYGCFAFHSGLLTNGCPSPEDSHALHGEFPCSAMDSSYLRFNEEEIQIHSEVEYVKGFGHHYLANPSVTMHKDASFIDIQLKVKNLSKYQPMPLQYMCHINFAYAENGVMAQNIPDEAFRLRTSIPDHVKPTQEWSNYMDELATSKKLISNLDHPEMYDPEICFFAEKLNTYVEQAEFMMQYNKQNKYFIEFNTTELPYVTRWLLHNADQKVAAFALPGTCLPEGYLAAEKAGTLIYVNPNEEKQFTVRTGIKLL